MNSSFFKLNLQDLLKGIIVAVLTAFFAGLAAFMSSGVLPDAGAFKTIGISSLAAGCAYLAKNLFTNSNGELATKDEVIGGGNG